jgi:hypothetical protein
MKYPQVTPFSVEMWHIINGLWVHIVQHVNEAGDIRYFTDGVEQFPTKSSKLETPVEDSQDKTSGVAPMNTTFVTTRDSILDLGMGVDMKSISDVRITKTTVYKLSWWRRLLLRLTGSSHLGKKVPYPS